MSYAMFSPEGSYLLRHSVASPSAANTDTSWTLISDVPPVGSYHLIIGKLVDISPDMKTCIAIMNDTTQANYYITLIKHEGAGSLEQATSNSNQLITLNSGTSMPFFIEIVRTSSTETFTNCTFAEPYSTGLYTYSQRVYHSAAAATPFLQLYSGPGGTGKFGSTSVANYIRMA